jgi:hypothetical protein
VISVAWPLSSTVADQGEFDVASVVTVLSPSDLRSSTQAEFDINNNTCSDEMIIIKDIEQVEDHGGDPSPSPVPLSLSLICYGWATQGRIRRPQRIDCRAIGR